LVSYDKLRKKDSGARNVRILYCGKPLRIQIDGVRVPFGVGSYVPTGASGSTHAKHIASGSTYAKHIASGSTYAKHTIEISMPDTTAISQLDTLNLRHCVDMSREWWGKSMSHEVMSQSEKYKSQLKPDPKRGVPRLRVKLPVYENRAGFTVFCPNRQIVDPEMTKQWGWAHPGMEIRIIAECEGLWVVNTNVYCTWKAVQIMVLSTPMSFNQYAFLDYEEDYEEDQEE
jgi:hypothetical protein